MLEMSSSPAASVGLRHILEDGLTILAGRSVEAGRREFVIRDLASLFEQARRGEQFTQNRRLFVPAAEASALEAFSLVFGHLRHAYGDELGTKLERASLAFTRLSDPPGPNLQNLNLTEHEVAREFLSLMLESLKRDEAYALQATPTPINLQ